HRVPPRPPAPTGPSGTHHRRAGTHHRRAGTRFDCSGLVQWAYARAGVGLPRTSQAQRNAGRHVPLAQARPGDLVTYRSDASHVALYVGGGQVIHAPRPGAPVRYDPVGMMPVSAVTRV
ncbi:C40 family peptidase, partial [Streptomyces fradiae]|uniref:C40 family peptidase n=1 Tax=Streptomyces fradiae TaxID=1906 RepID=UPI00340411FF